MRSYPSCWNKTLASLGFKRRLRKKKAQPHRRMLFESLEKRELLAGDSVSITLTSTADLPDADLTDGLPLAANGEVTLRAAIQEANASGVPTSIFLPEGNYNLTRTGTESSNAAFNDLDITGDVTIVGAGAGLSVIEMSAAASSHGRVFDVTDGGTLTASRLTVTGGHTIHSGGGLYVREGGAANLDQVAIVSNTAEKSGAGLYNAGTTTLTQSVVTNNTAHGEYAGGGVFSASGSTFTMGSTISAGNSTNNTTGNPIVHADPDLVVWHSNVTSTSQGNNILGDSDYLWNNFGVADDVIVQDPDYVVTSVADAFEATNDNAVLSLREAIVDANANAGTIVLPAWNHLLTLTGTETSNAAFNDLDISGNMTIIGAGAGLSVIEMSAAASSHGRVFDVTDGGTLTASRLTVTGGHTIHSGGGLYVREGGMANLDQVAIVDNTAGKSGGGFYNAGTTTITRSVVNNNTSNGEYAGGGIFSASGSTFTMGSTISAGNTTNNTTGNPTVHAAPDLVVWHSNVTSTSQGNNILGDSDYFWNNFGVAGDIILQAPDYVVTSVTDRVDAADGGLSLREAVINADMNSGTISLPAWHHSLTSTYAYEIDGSANVSANDLDITRGDVTIVGAGAGLTVIDASALSSDGIGQSDRVFQVGTNPSASLNLSRLTLTGGHSVAGTSGNGGAILVEDGASVKLSEVVLVGNTASHVGGAIWANRSGSLIVRDSVLTGNTANHAGGIYLDPSTSLTVGGSVFANNTASLSLFKNIQANNVSVTNEGNNLTDNNHGASNSASAFDTAVNDHIGLVNYVVTNIADTVDASDNTYALSLREAVMDADEADGTIWLPAWHHRLTSTYAYELDGTANALANDLEITVGEVVIVGAGAGLSVIDASALTND